jgi:glycosyltransferase involved in cell wall biosynthesis
VQERIHAASRYVTLLSPGAEALWAELFGPRDNVLLVPGAADRELPPLGPDPFPPAAKRRILFAGNIYSPQSQPEAHAALVAKLNRLGRLLDDRGCRLTVIGAGDVRGLDARRLDHRGAVPHDEAWSWIRHAHVGVVVTAGPFMHNNESTKIYHYLRAGLPVVSESGFPNDGVVRESGLGYVVESGDLEGMATRIEEAVNRAWDREPAVRYILAHHTWDRRVEIYDRLLTEHFS